MEFSFQRRISDIKCRNFLSTIGEAACDIDRETQREKDEFEKHDEGNTYTHETVGKHGQEVNLTGEMRVKKLEEAFLKEIRGKMAVKHAVRMPNTYDRDIETEMRNKKSGSNREDIRPSSAGCHGNRDDGEMREMINEYRNTLKRHTKPEEQV